MLTTGKTVVQTTVVAMHPTMLKTDSLKESARVLWFSLLKGNKKFLVHNNY